MELQELTSFEILAFGIACVAHGQQKRKYSGAPYIIHPWAVASIVKARGMRDEVVAAAFLHDVLEDTRVDEKALRAQLLNGVHYWPEQPMGPTWESKCMETFGLVRWLTDPAMKPEQGNREARIALNREHIAQAPPEAKSIKLADMIHNTQSIVRKDPDFAKVYMAEKAAALPYLREGDDELWRRAQQQVQDYQTERLDDKLEEISKRQ